MPKNPLTKFKKADSERRCRTIGLSCGEVGVGKTSFWLSAPGPILVQSLDKGLEGIIEKHAQAGKDIYFEEYDWSAGKEDFSQDYAVEIRDKIMEDFVIALEHARTVLWDKETNIWEVFRYAEFGGPTDAPKDYAKLNQRYINLVNLAKEGTINFGLIQSMKNEWGSYTNPNTGKKSGAPTGQRIPVGFSQANELVYVEMLHRREAVKDSVSEFYFDIGKCRQNTALQDQTFPASTFAEFGQLLIEGSEEGDWL